MRAVLGTSVVIAADVAPPEGDLAVSAVTLAELHLGVLVAAGYGRSAAAVVAAGRRPRPRSPDLLVPATALVHDARLHTRDAADLVGADDLVEVLAV